MELKYEKCASFKTCESKVSVSLSDQAILVNNSDSSMSIKFWYITEKKEYSQVLI